MTDKELLELAAKAMGALPLPEGLELDSTPDGGLAFCGGGQYVTWNPLRDDGDALRLSAKLSIDITYSTSGVAAWCSAISDYMKELGGNDSCHATRRAIVRAAAEIGKAM